MTASVPGRPDPRSGDPGRTKRPGAQRGLTALAAGEARSAISGSKTRRDMVPPPRPRSGRYPTSHSSSERISFSPKGGGGASPSAPLRIQLPSSRSRRSYQSAPAGSAGSYWMTDAVASAPTGTGRPPRLTSGLTTTSRRRSRNLSTSRAPSGTSIPPRFFGLSVLSTTRRGAPASLLTAPVRVSRLRKSAFTCCARSAKRSFSRLPRRPGAGEAWARSRARSAISFVHSRSAGERAGSAARALSLRGASFTEAKYGTPLRRVKAKGSGRARPPAHGGVSSTSVELRLHLELQDVVAPERRQSGPPRAFDGDVVRAQEDVVRQAVDHRRREAEDTGHVQDRDEARLEPAVQVVRLERDLHELVVELVLVLEVLRVDLLAEDGELAVGSRLFAARDTRDPSDDGRGLPRLLLAQVAEVPSAPLEEVPLPVPGGHQDEGVLRVERAEEEERVVADHPAQVVGLRDRVDDRAPVRVLRARHRPAGVQVLLRDEGELVDEGFRLGADHAAQRR